MKLHLILIALVMILLYASCGQNDACELTDDDMEWLLEEYDSLQYLRNGTDTIHINVETVIGQKEYTWSMGVRTGSNNYYGYTKLCFCSDIDTIFFNYWINACSQKIHIETVKSNSFNIVHAQDFYINKDSITNEKLSMLKKEYDNCFCFSTKYDSMRYEFFFVKEFGIIKFSRNEDEKLELIPEK